MTCIVVNVSLGYIRKHKTSPEGEVALDAGETPLAAQLPDAGSDPFTATRRRELRQILSQAMGQLRAIHRQVIDLHDIQQRTLKTSPGCSARPSAPSRAGCSTAAANCSASLIS